MSMVIGGEDPQLGHRLRRVGGCAGQWLGRDVSWRDSRETSVGNSLTLLFYFPSTAFFLLYRHQCA